MNYPPRNKRSYKVLLLSGAVLMAAVGMAVSLVLAQSVGFSSSNQTEASGTMTVEASFDPATYDLPDTIGGYKVLAVLTLANTPCIRPSAIRLLLQASEPDVESYLANSHPGTIQQDLDQLAGREAVDWEIVIGGPGATREQIVAGYDTFKNIECVELGHIVPATPSE